MDTDTTTHRRGLPALTDPEVDALQSLRYAILALNACDRLAYEVSDSPIQLVRRALVNALTRLPGITRYAAEIIERETLANGESVAYNYDLYRAGEIGTGPERVLTTEGHTKHTCTPDGKAQPFGRRAPLGECARCDELRDGAAPRDDHALRRQTPATVAQDNADRRAHRATCPMCQTGGVCTAFDW